MRRDFQGGYADLCFVKGDLHVVSVDTSGLIVCRNVDADTVVWQRSVAEFGFLMFLNAAVDDNGDVLACGKANVGASVVLVGANQQVVKSVGGGNYPASIGRRNGRLVWFIMRGEGCAENEVGVYGLDGTLLERLPFPSHISPTSSQGIRFITDDGQPKYGDETLANVFAGQLIHEWMQRGPWTAGQGSDGGVTVANSDGRWWSAMPGLAFFPRIAVRGARVAALKIDRQTVYVEDYTPPYPQGASAPAPPPPQPVPQPTPIPEPVPVNIPNYLEHVKKVAAVLGNRYTDDSLTDEQRIDEAAKVTAKAASDIYHGRNGAVQDRRVGLFKKPNKYGFDENRLYFDLGNGTACFAKIVIQTGAAHASLGWNETDHIFPEILYADRGGVGWMVPPLIGSDAPTQPGTPQQPPSSDLAKQVAALAARVAKLEQQPPSSFPQRIALKSDHGKYGSVQPDGSIVFDRDSSGPWETVTVEAK